MPLKPFTLLGRVDRALVRVRVQNNDLAVRRRRLEAEQRRLDRKRRRLQERHEFLVRKFNLLTVGQITARALAILHQKVNLVSALNRSHDDENMSFDSKPGSSFRIRLPVQYTIKTGD